MKTKYLGVFFVILVSCMSLTAQEKQMHIARIEGDVNIGIALGFTNPYIWCNLNYGAEMRYNFQKLPFDAGIGYTCSFIVKNPGMIDNHTDISNFFYATCDYNFRQMKDVSLFAGVGLGYVSMCLNQSYYVAADPDGNIHRDAWGHSGSVCVMPRVGVEFWHRLRLTCGYQIQEKSCQHFMFSITCVIGGGVRGK